MLNLSEIANRIASPESCNVTDISDLQQFSEKYPYAQVFPILYLKALAISNDIRFDEELSKYAYRISDREQLYELIKTLPNITNSNTEDTTLVHVEHKNEIQEHPVEAISLQSTTIHEEIEKIEEDLLTEEVDLSQDTEWILDDIENIEEDEEDEPTIPLHFHEEDDSEMHTNETHDSTDTFEKDLISEAIASSYILHVSEIRTQDEPLTTANTSDSVEAMESDNSTENKIDTDRTTVDSSIGNYSFTSWLQKNSSLTSTQRESSTDKEHIDSLVERFIRDEPSIQRPIKSEEKEEKPKREFFSATKKAKESLDSAKAPVSETLAKIYTVQGNYPKAIEAYEQLMLSIPEKKTLFASQIKELKKKLNS